MKAQDPADLLANIREEVIGLLFNRHVFRTHQEIVRLNPRLQGDPRITFEAAIKVPRTPKSFFFSPGPTS